MVLIAMAAVLLMNVRERRQHHQELAAIRGELREARNSLATHGLSTLLEPFESDEVRIVVLDLYGQGQSKVRNTSVVARRVLLETTAPADVFTVDRRGKRMKVCETEIRDGPNAGCSLTVLAHVPRVRPTGSPPHLEFGLYPAGGSASGRSLGATIGKGDGLEDHFRFDLQTGVYPRGEELDFYALGGNAAGDLRPVRLLIAPRQHVRVPAAGANTQVVVPGRAAP